MIRLELVQRRDYQTDPVVIPFQEQRHSRGRVFPDPVPAITVVSSPRVGPSVRSTCQSYGVIAGYKVVTASEDVR